MRARGWRVTYPMGNTQPEEGLPMANARRWDAGLEVHWTRGAFETAASLTQGSLTDPRIGDDNRGKGLEARVAWRPVPGLVAGLSAARGDYLAREVETLVGGPRAQRLAGADLEY